MIQQSSIGEENDIQSQLILDELIVDDIDREVSAFTRKYVSFVDRFRRFIIVFWMVAFCVGAVFAKKFMGTVVLVYNPPIGTPGDIATNVLHQEFPQADSVNDVYLILTTKDKSSLLGNYYNETSHFVKEISSSVVEWGKTKPTPVTIYEPMNYFMLKELNAHALSLQFLDDMKNPENATGMIAILHMRSGFAQGSQEGNKLSDFVDEEISRLKKKFWKDIPMDAKATGMVVFCRDMLDGTEQDMLKMDSLSFPFALLILALMLKSVRLLIIPILSMMLTVVVSFMLMYPVAVMTQVIAVAPSTMMSVAVAFSIDYSLFLLTRFREGIDNAESIYDSVELMVDTAGHTIMVSGATIAVCWLGLLFFPVPLLSTIGLGAGMTVVVTFLINISLTPSLLLEFKLFLSNFEAFGFRGCWCYEKCRKPDERAVDHEIHRRQSSSAHSNSSPCSFDAFGREHRMIGSEDATSFAPLVSPQLEADGTVRGEIRSPTFGQYNPVEELKFLNANSVWYRLGYKLFGTTRRAALAIIIGCAVILPLAPTAVSFHKSEDIKTFAPTTAEGTVAANILQKRFGAGRLSPYQLLVFPDESTKLFSNEFFWHVQHVLYNKVFPLTYGSTPALIPGGVYGMMLLNGKNISFSPSPRRLHDASVLGCAVSAPKVIGVCADQRCTTEMLGCEQDESCNKELSCVKNNDGQWITMAQCLMTNFKNTTATHKLTHCVYDRCLHNASPNFVKTVDTPNLGTTSETSLNKNVESDSLDCASVVLNFVRSINGLKTNATLVTLNLNLDVFGTDGEQWLDDVRAVLEKQSKLDNYTYHISGGDVAGHDTVDTVYRLFPVVFAIILAVVFLLVGFSYRSLLVPTRAVFTICLTLILVYGLGVLTFEHGMLKWTGFHGFINPVNDSLTWLIPALVAPIAIGLGLDYDIFLLTRIYEYRQAGFKTKDSIMCGLAQTGGVITAAGVIMFFAFFGLSLSSSPALNQLSFFLVVAVLSDTFIIRTILVPSAMLLLGEKNWWPWKPATLEY